MGFDFVMTINVRPKVQERVRFYHGNAAKSDAMRAWCREVRTQVAEEMRIRNFPMYRKGENICVDAVYYTSVPDAWTKRKMHHYGLFTEEEKRGRNIDGNAEFPVPYSYGRGDIDNYNKALYDALNGVLWEDDGFIVENSNRKIISIEPRIEIAVRSLGNTQGDVSDG